MGPGLWPTLSQAYQMNMVGLRIQCLTWPLPRLRLLPGIPSSTGKILTHLPPLAHWPSCSAEFLPPAWPTDPRGVFPALISLPRSKPCQDSPLSLPLVCFNVLSTPSLPILCSRHTILRSRSYRSLSIWQTLTYLAKPQLQCPFLWAALPSILFL